MNGRLRFGWSLASAMLIASAACAGDWPQWLGPTRDGVSTEIVAPWKGSLKILWRVKAPEGHASPVVSHGKVYLHTAAGEWLEDDPKTKPFTEHVAAFNVNDGSMVWAARMERRPFQSQFGNGPRATPAVVDGRVYCFGVTGTFAMFDANTGKLLADQVDVVGENKGKVPYFGVSAAPLVEGGRVFLQVGGPEAGLIALDAKTGKTEAKVLKEPASYAAPTFMKFGKSPEVVVLNADAVYGISPAGTDVLWRYRFKDLLSESSTTPIRAGDKIIASSVTLGSVALKHVENNGKPAVEEVWRNPKLSCYFSTPVVAGKQLYLVTGKLIPPPQADLHCVDLATGNILWTKPKVGTYGATLIKLGDDKLLLLEESGDLVLLENNAEKYVELARAKICGETWAHPALANGKLLIRDRKELICVQLPSATVK